MGFEVDPRFKVAPAAARQRKTRKRLRIGLIALACCTVLGGVVFIGQFAFRDNPGGAIATGPNTAQDINDDETLNMVEDTGGDIIAARAPFIDLPRDPLILNLDQGVDGAGRGLTAPQLDRARVGAARSDQLIVVEDALVVQTTRLVTTIPSSRADLAFFQAARGEALALFDEGTSITGDAPSGDLVTVDGDEGSWGALTDIDSQSAETDTATYVQTSIQNTTSTSRALRTGDRAALYHDDIIVVRSERALGEILSAAGLNDAEVALVLRAADRRLNLDATLVAGSVVALRLEPSPRGDSLLQMTVYDAEKYVGTLVQIGAGRFETGADPWIGDDLMARTEQARTVVARQGDIRLLDAVYSASIRNGMSTTLVGELVVMLSQYADLDRFAAVGDNITILYANAPGPVGQGAGQLLFAGIRGPSGQIDCYVVANPAENSFECHRARMMQASRGGGLIVPVSGIKTSDFGPRMHPILRQMRNHNGVDWGAPTGTPVHAAADGIVAAAGNGGGYGNLVTINHSGSRQTRYAHLNAFADGMAAGARVKAGDVIGYVGTTGRSTGPHLHFELIVNGVHVDPLSYAAAVSGGETAGGAAVEALVNQIIRVESAGNSRAQNSRSTATGLGQFIDSTWLRMMQTYRPDLAQSLSRRDQLQLRFNPEISREMVRNLARESEAYLRTRGHDVTAGRLYLAHFLGAEGAHVALSSNPVRLVSDVMGAGVVNANPFLRGDTIGELWAWADRKMNSASAVVVAARPAPVSTEITTYINTINGVLKSL